MKIQEVVMEVRKKVHENRRNEPSPSLFTNMKESELTLGI